MSTTLLARRERLNEEAQAELAAARDLLRVNTERLNDGVADRAQEMLTYNVKNAIASVAGI